MKCYGVYFSGRLKKRFSSIRKARKFAEESFRDTKVKTITISQIKCKT